MEIEKEDKIIQIILNQLCLYEYRLTNRKLISKACNNAYRGDENIVYNKLINEYKLIETREKSNGYYQLTKKGGEVQKVKGWVIYKGKQKRLIERKSKKDIYDYLFSKYRYKTYWLLLICSILASIYSGYDFMERIRKLNYELDKPVQQSKKDKVLEQKKLHTSISNQENLDSLYDYKNHDLLKKDKSTE